MYPQHYPQAEAEQADMLSADNTMQRIATHHIYEYEKGIRYLVLCTLSHTDCQAILPKLRGRGIDYYCKQTPSGNKTNLFFGRSACIETVRRLLESKDLHELGHEEDFIIGAMLGYDLCGQCERYLGRLCQSQQQANTA